jgi:hypothetical protein
MGIIIVIASMAALVAPRLRENQKVTRGAEQLQGWLFVAKQEAYRDKLARGVRLVVDPNAPPGSVWVRECLYIEQPEEYRGGVIQVPNPQQPPPAPYNMYNGNAWPSTATAFIRRQTIPGQPPTPLDLTQGNVVQVGDFLTFDVAPYTTHRIAFVYPQSNGTGLVFAAADGTPSNVPGSGQIQNEPAFHITRQARPRAGEANLKLPKDIIVDLVENKAPVSQLPGIFNQQLISDAGDNALDIIFNPRGGVMGLNGITGGPLTPGANGGPSAGGTIILWVRDSTKPFPPQSGQPEGENVLVVVYSRTGFVAAHPPNLTNFPNNVFSFVRDGKNSGM